MKENFCIINGNIINISTKYYNIDSFFRFEIMSGLKGFRVIFRSKYGSKHDLCIDLDSDNVEDAKKEVEEFCRISRES